MIRAYAPEDLEELLDTWYRASKKAHPFLSDTFLNEERARISDEWLPIAQTFVCEIDGRVVGFMSLVGNEIGGLFVAPEHQRRGHGREFVERARKVIGEPVVLYVFAANQNAQRFYEACGFEVVGHRINDDVGLPELKMELPR